MTDWPPPHSVRLSSRARRVLLRIHPERGLEIVTPKRLNERRIIELLEQHRPWIVQHLAHVKTWPAERLPATIDLPALGQQWTVEYAARADRPCLKACPARRHLTLDGESSALWPLLGRWLTAQAKAHLLPQIEALAREQGRALQGASIRWASSRWGSCSRRGTISLSARLLFLPPEAVHYVMLHELTHLEHFHHGPAFWQALEQRLPGALLIDARLRHAGRQLPAWLPLLKQS